jgi:hypothetical protein
MEQNQLARLADSLPISRPTKRALDTSTDDNYLSGCRAKVQKVGDKDVAASAGYNLQYELLCNPQPVPVGLLTSDRDFSSSRFLPQLPVSHEPSLFTSNGLYMVDPGQPTNSSIPDGSWFACGDFPAHGSCEQGIYTDGSCGYLPSTINIDWSRTECQDTSRSPSCASLLS